MPLLEDRFYLPTFCFWGQKSGYSPYQMGVVETTSNNSAPASRHEASCVANGLMHRCMGEIALHLLEVLRSIYGEKDRIWTVKICDAGGWIQLPEGTQGKASQYPL